MWIVFPDYKIPDFTTRNPGWYAPVPETWPNKAHWVVATTTPGKTKYWYSAKLAADHPLSFKRRWGNLGMVQQTIWQEGWPMRTTYRERHVVSVYFETHHKNVNRTRPPGGLGGISYYPRYQPQNLREGIFIPEILTRIIRSKYYDDWYLPVLPIWSGLIFNTIFYAILLWLLFPGRYILRRRRRIKRGLCGQCGYIVAPNLGVPGASPNCPECGTPIPPGTGTPEIIKSKI